MRVRRCSVRVRRCGVRVSGAHLQPCSEFTRRCGSLSLSGGRLQMCRDHASGRLPGVLHECRA